MFFRSYAVFHVHYFVNQHKSGITRMGLPPRASHTYHRLCKLKDSWHWHPSIWSHYFSLFCPSTFFIDSNPCWTHLFPVYIIKNVKIIVHKNRVKMCLPSCRIWRIERENRLEIYVVLEFPTFSLWSVIAFGHVPPALWLFLDKPHWNL